MFANRERPPHPIGAERIGSTRSWVADGDKLDKAVRGEGLRMNGTHVTTPADGGPKPGRFVLGVEIGTAHAPSDTVLARRKPQRSRSPLVIRRSPWGGYFAARAGSPAVSTELTIGITTPDPKYYLDTHDPHKSLRWIRSRTRRSRQPGNPRRTTEHNDQACRYDEVANGGWWTRPRVHARSLAAMA